MLWSDLQKTPWVLPPKGTLLRDPVERAYSHWKERRSNDGDPLGFADAIAAEEGRLVGEEARILEEINLVSSTVAAADPAAVPGT